MPKKTAVKKAPQRGRPPLAKGKKRSFAGWLPISADEKAAIQGAADRAGKALSVWARDILLAAAAKK